MTKDDIVGVYRTVGEDTISADGKMVTDEQRTAQIMYSPDGYMAGFVMRPGRPPFASGDRFLCSTEEMRAAHEGFQAYCGTYEVEWTRARIVHHVAADFFPNYVGTDLVRHFVLENGSLVLETPPVVRGGETWTLLRRRTWHSFAQSWLDLLSAHGVSVERIDADLEDEAWAWLRAHDERPYSFVDATSFALMRKLRLREALAFDGDFASAGFVELRP